MRCNVVLDLQDEKVIIVIKLGCSETHVLLGDVLRQSSDHDGVIRRTVLPVIFTRGGLWSVSLPPGTPVSVSVPASPLPILLPVSAPTATPAPPPLTPRPGAGPGPRPPVSPSLSTPVPPVPPLPGVALGVPVVVLAVGRRSWRRGRGPLLPPTPGVGGGQTHHLGWLGLGHEDWVLGVVGVTHLTTSGQQDGSVTPGSVHSSVGVELGCRCCSGLSCGVLGNIIM